MVEVALASVQRCLLLTGDQNFPIANNPFHVGCSEAAEKSLQLRWVKEL
jgi:hypothetical protein